MVVITIYRVLECGNMQLQLNTEMYKCVPDGWEKMFERDLMYEYKRLLDIPTLDNPLLPAVDELCVQMDVFFYECVSFHEFDDPSAYHNLVDTEHKDRFYDIAQEDHYLSFYNDVAMFSNRHHLSVYLMDYENDGYMHLPIKEVW
jgi:hypothetical protein